MAVNLSKGGNTEMKRLSKARDKEVERILRAFFDPEHSTNINLDRLRDILGGNEERCDLIINRIKKRADREVKQEKAIKTHGCIGDDGAGGPLDPGSSFVAAYKAAKEKGIPWYHFDSHISLFGISRCIPSPGKIVEVV
jgi:hypothetical protein